MRLAIAFGITLAVLAAELVGAWLTNSLALLADAAHMTTDAIGLGIAFGAAVLVGRPATPSRSWGFKRAEVVAAAVQALLLIGAAVYVLVEAVHRFGEPPGIPGAPLLAFGVVGLLGNIASILVLVASRRSSLNARAAFLEVVADAIGSVCVVVAAVVVLTTGFAFADLIASLVIGALIVPRAVLLLRDALRIVLEAAPRELDVAEVREHLEAVPHVIGVHDLHITQIASDLPVLTAHVVVDDECFRDGHAPEILDDLRVCVASCFPISIEHSTFQLEPVAHGAEESAAHR